MRNAWDLLMRHGVDYIINPSAKTKGGILFRVAGIVGPLPGVADVVVKEHSESNPFLIVVDGAPVRIGTACWRVADNAPGSRNLIAFFQIVDRMKDGIHIRDLDDGAAGE